MLLEERIKQIVREVIAEERGINTDVYNAANEIIDLIRKDADLKDSRDEYKPCLDGIAYVISGNFTYQLREFPIIVKYKSYIFKDLQSYELAQKKYPRQLMNASARCGGKNGSILNVSYNRTLSDGYDESIRDRVEHELNHAFQSGMIDGELTSSSLGELVYNVLNKQGDNELIYDKDINKCAILLYYCRNYEQDAYNNGLYNWLMNSNLSAEEVLVQTGVYKNIGRIEEKIAYLQEIYNSTDRTRAKKIHDYFHLRVGEIINKGIHAIERYKKLINRTMYKYAEETGKQLKFVG